MPLDKKTNEITIFPELIKLLDLRNCIVTADALNTQKDIAGAIINAEADYILPVKGNHGDLKDDIEQFFNHALERSFRGIDADDYKTLDKDHGRVDCRQYYVIDAEDLPDKDLWKGLRSIGMVLRERHSKHQSEKEVSYYLMSTEIDARILEKCVRGHWGVENSLHWRLDVIFREDESRYREKIGAANLSYVRKMALGALSKDKSVKGGIQSKRLRAAASCKYREYTLKNLL